MGINSSVKDGKTFLQLAFEGKQAKVVEFLLKNGSDLNVGNQYKQNPLMYAVTKGNAQAVELLIHKWCES